MPAGTDTVVIQEHVRVDGEHVSIDSTAVAGKNVRRAGEDVQKDQIILREGVQLEAADLGVLASLGIRQVKVARRLKVAFFTTGDELVALEEQSESQTLEPGMLYDSNRYTLRSLLQTLGVDVVDLGIVRDNEADTRQALEKAAQVADVIVTSGGVSAGDADYVTRAFHHVGEVSFWKLAMRPGRPLAFGFVKEAAFFGLPGNPVAVMITFLQFVQPAIKYMLGMSNIEPLCIPAICRSHLRKSQGRVEYQRGIAQLDDTGRFVVDSTGKQGAGRLSSMSAANCLIVIDEEVAAVAPGDIVLVQPFRGLLSG